MHITGLYAGVLALIGILLGVKVSGVRMKTQVSISDGGKPDLAEAIRRHANFAEHVPLALILLAIVETNGLDPRGVHALGAVLTLARIVHPFGVHHRFGVNALRATGATATLLVTLAAAGIAVWQALTAG